MHPETSSKTNKINSNFSAVISAVVNVNCFQRTRYVQLKMKMLFPYRGVKTDVLNEKKQAVIHLATELNKVSVLEVMSRHKDKIDIQQGGEHGRTALHIAAIYDHEECARILVMHVSFTLGVRIYERKWSSYTPTHSYNLTHLHFI